jgi:VWFA-related protein
MLGRLTSMVLLTLVGLCGHVAARAQEQTQSGLPSTPGPVIRATTRLVQVSVIVQGKDGAPVTGLKKESFTLLDQGQAQQIAFFSANVPANATTNGVPPRALAPNEFTNRADLKGQDPGATIVVLFDSLNTSFEDQAYAREHILRFLQTVKPQDRVAIFALTNELMALHDFNEDASSLANSVARFSPQLLAAFDASHTPDFHVAALASDPSWTRFEGHVNNANGEISDSRVVDRFRITYAAIESLAAYVADIPGHKSLVWVSGGIPIQFGSNRIGVADRDNFRFDNSGAASRDMDGLTRLLNRANMAIYPIDVHGIDVDDSSGAFFMRQDQRETFRMLADATGGKASYGTNDVAGAINSAFEDGRYTYVLGFYPNHGTWDGKFRSIKITLELSDAHLRYRHGYFAIPDRSSTDATMKTDLQLASLSPLDATSLGLIVTGKPIEHASSRALQLRVTLNPAELLLRDAGNRKKGGVDLLFLQKDAKGKFLAAWKQHFAVSLSEADCTYLAKAGMVFQRQITMDSGTTELRVLARDANSGALGSVNIPAKTFFQ